MTVQDLRALLAEYPDDAPVFDGKGYDLHASSVTRMRYDDWAHSTTDPENPGYETPGKAYGISIGRKF